MTTETKRNRVLAVGLAFLGLATAVISMGRVWSRLTSSDYPGRLWPLPGLYLVEAVVLPVLVLWAVVVAHHRGARFGAWLAVGALTTMGLLGAMSIGLHMALALLFLIPAIVLSDDGRSALSRRVAGFVLGSILQGGVMLGVVQYLLRRPTSGQ